MNAVPLGDVVVPISRKGPSPGSVTFTYIDLSSVDTARKRIASPTEIATADAPSRARQNLRTGDVLVSTVRPNLNGVAAVEGHLDGAIGSTGFAVLRADRARLGERYLFHWVRTPQFVETMTRLATGASYPAVSDAIVKSSRIPLPPLPEQRRIAAILDEADALRAHHFTTASLLVELKQALFLDSFGPVQQLQRGDRIQALSTIADVIDCPHSTPEWTTTGVTCLRTSNLGRGEWNWADHRFVSEETHSARTRRSELIEGDIILSREGTVGVGAIVPPNIRMSMGQRLVQVRPRQPQIEPEYLLQYLLLATNPKTISHLMVGSTSTHLNVRDLRSLRVYVPPIDAQRRFAARVRAQRSTMSSMQSRVEVHDVLFASLQHRAFRGEL